VVVVAVVVVVGGGGGGAAAAAAGTLVELAWQAERKRSSARSGAGLPRTTPRAAEADPDPQEARLRSETALEPDPSALQTVDQYKITCPVRCQKKSLKFWRRVFLALAPCLGPGTLGELSAAPKNETEWCIMS
jgi:hypothetical protein